MASRDGKRKADTVGPSAATKKRQQEQGDDDWCASCWSWPKDDCRGARHRLLDKGTAKKEAQAELAAACKEVEQRQARLDDLERAVADKAPVLEAVVDCDDGDRNGLFIPGCDLRISLAAEGLTNADKANIIKALDDKQVSFPMPTKPREYASIWIGKALSKQVIAKFPDRMPGQKLPKNVVVMSVEKNRWTELQVWTRGMLPHQGQGTKIFGWLTATTDEFWASCCDGSECEPHRDCICKGGEATSTISEVKFAD